MLLVWIPCTSLQNFSFPCNWIILRIHLWSSSSSSSFNKISQNDIYFKGWLRLFVDYVNSREKGQLQKSHYLSEFLRLREILNFFQQRISRRFIWNWPHRPIGRPNRPFLNDAKFFSQKVGKWPKFQPNYVGRKWPMHQILAGNMFS